MMKFETKLLLGDELTAYWPQIWRDMEKVPHIWQLYWTREAIEEEVFLGRAQVWAAGPRLEFGLQIRAVVLTRVLTYPKGRFLEGMFMFGNSLEEALPVLHATFQKFAMMQQCQNMLVQGREGWGAALKPLGFERISSTYVSAVPDVRIN